MKSIFRAMLFSVLVFGFSSISLSTNKETQLESQTVAVGEAVWNRVEQSITSGVVVQGKVFEEWTDYYTLQLNPGDTLVLIREKKKPKACVRQTRTSLGSMLWEGCLIDKDEDGKFEIASAGEGPFTKRMDPPVPYQRSSVPDRRVGSRQSRAELIYLGATGDTIRLGYREYSNGLARPAFSENFDIPLSENFPQQVSTKYVNLVLENISSVGLRFRNLPQEAHDAPN